MKFIKLNPTVSICVLVGAAAIAVHSFFPVDKAAVAAVQPAHQFDVQQAPPLPIEPNPRAPYVRPLWTYPNFPSAMIADLPTPASPEMAVAQMGGYGHVTLDQTHFRISYQVDGHAGDGCE